MKRAYAIFWGIYVDDSLKSNTLVFLQRADPYLPSKLSYCVDQFKCVGGLIEEGEDTIEALKREIEEETNGWFDIARIKSTKWRRTRVN